LTEFAPLPHALHPLLAQALRRKGYDSLTAVQAAVADPKLSDRDMLVSSKTGSGKTVAYGLGMATALLPDTLLQKGGKSPVLPPAGKPLALIIAPTRELALQVQRELLWLYEDTGAVITSCVGGMDQRAERKQLDRGVHIVVGTPGRLLDHLSRGALQLDQLAVAVLDEADEMLDLGFREDLELILAATPPERRTLLFSATLPKGIVALATRFQRNAARIEVATDLAGHADIEHRAALVRPNGIEKGVVNLLRETDSPAALVFCNTRDAVRHLHATLMERGFSAVILSGELGQHERNQALQALRDGRARVCIATDVAARGIDLPHLGLVIHADLPHDSEVLQHRSGRTGRAGRKGISVMLVPPSRRGKAMRLYSEGGISPQWVALPSADDIRALDRARALADETPFADLTDDDREMAAALLESRPASEIAAALAHVLRLRLPEPEEIDPLPLEDTRPPGKNRPERAPGGAGQFRWFELNIGRHDRAEPKGILRMLSGSGGVERRHIGGIRIHDRTCHVEIAIEAADQFERRTANAAEDEIRVRPIDEPAAKPRREFGPRPPRHEAAKPSRDERSRPAFDPGRKPHPKGKGKGKSPNQR
jgi:ATP-dependent RNA helicase DeaD